MSRRSDTVRAHRRAVPGGAEAHADVAQLVEHHLAKVRVAGSSPVVRSEVQSLAVEWPRGEATACKAVYTGSNPVSTSVPPRSRAISSVGERFLDTEEVTGSIPVSPTKKVPGHLAGPGRMLLITGTSLTGHQGLIGDTAAAHPGGGGGYQAALRPKTIAPGTSSSGRITSRASIVKPASRSQPSISRGWRW